jgi:hypothetical protein
VLIKESLLTQEHPDIGAIDKPDGNSEWCFCRREGNDNIGKGDLRLSCDPYCAPTFGMGEINGKQVSNVAVEQRTICASINEGELFQCALRTKNFNLNQGTLEKVAMLIWRIDDAIFISHAWKSA